MGNLNGRTIASKWAKTAVLLSHPEIAPHIPTTKHFNRENLKSMLDAYGFVVIKPIVGSGGNGVIKVMKTSDGYTFIYFTNTRRFNDFAAMLASLNRKRRKRPYLIQRGIDLATVDGRPIDYRVKYVKEGGRWHYRAIVGRIARPGLFVTNLSQGGTLVKGAQGISRSFSSAHVKSKKGEMRRLTVISTKTMESKFPGIGQLGFDYGIDKEGKIWILEVNTSPQ